MTAKNDLRNLIDAYASLSDEKKVVDVMQLFTKDANYKVYMNGALVADITGTDALEQDFNGHASLVKMYFTMNGQHEVAIDGASATGVSFTQIKMIREVDGTSNITDYSVRYDDLYLLEGGKWRIKQRTGHFIIIEARAFAS